MIPKSFVGALKVFYPKLPLGWFRFWLKGMATPARSRTATGFVSKQVSGHNRSLAFAIDVGGGQYTCPPAHLVGRPPVVVSSKSNLI